MTIEYCVKVPGKNLAPLRPGQIRYVLAREGTYLERCTTVFSSCALVGGPLPLLESHAPSCVLHCGKIPTAMIAQMLGFFQEAHWLYGGEAALILLYSPQRRAFRWLCPSQKVEVYEYRGYLSASDSVEFENPVELPAGFQRFGDAHSHIGHAAPSYVDHRDEAHQDGLHMVIGHVSKTPTYHIDFVVDGSRFRVPPEIILASQPAPPYPRPPKSWLNSVRLVKRPSWYSRFSWEKETMTAGSIASSNNPEPRKEDQKEQSNWWDQDRARQVDWPDQRPQQDLRAPPEHRRQSQEDGRGNKQRDAGSPAPLDRQWRDSGDGQMRRSEPARDLDGPADHTTLPEHSAPDQTPDDLPGKDENSQPPNDLKA